MCVSCRLCRRPELGACLGMSLQNQASTPHAHRTQIPQAWGNFCMFIKVTRGHEQQDTSPSSESLPGKAILPPLQFRLLAWAEGLGVARTPVQGCRVVLPVALTVGAGSHVLPDADGLFQEPLNAAEVHATVHQVLDGTVAGEAALSTLQEPIKNWAAVPNGPALTCTRIPRYRRRLDSALPSAAYPPAGQGTISSGCATNTPYP